MAIYHLHAKIISRKTGRSSTGAAAYRAGEKIIDERTTVVHDYSRKRGVIHAEVIMPKDSAWHPIRSELWNAVELKNKREDSQVAREFELALPMELTDNQRLELAKIFAHEISDKYGIAADISLHKPKKGENHHVHILTTTNGIEGNGLGKKVRVLDMIANARGEGEDKGRNEIDYLRERWEILTNDALAHAGHESRIDRRTLEAQGIDRESVHESRAVREMEARGQETYARKLRESKQRERDIRRELTEVRSQRQEAEIFEAEEQELLEKQEIERKRLADEAVEEAAQKKRTDEAAAAKKLAEEAKAEREKAVEQEKLKTAAAEPVSDLSLRELARNQWREAGKEFISKNKSIGGFEANTPPQPVKIYGYEAVPHEDGTVFYHPGNSSNKVAFVDRKTSLELYENSDKTIVEMLNLSAKKWTNGFYIRGDDEFRARAEALAKKWGLADKVKNPLTPISVSPTPTPKVEPTSPIGEREQQKRVQTVSRTSYELRVSTLDMWTRFILDDMQREQKGLEKLQTAQSLDEKIKRKQESVEDLKKQEGGVIKRFLLTYEVVADRKKEEKELAELLKERKKLGDAPAIKPQFKTYTSEEAKRLSEEKYPEYAESVRLYEEQQRERDEEKSALEVAEQTPDEEPTQTPHEIDVHEPTDGEQQDDTLITSKNMTVGDARAVLEMIRENIGGDTTHPAWRDAEWTVQNMRHSSEDKAVPEREAKEILEAFELSRLSAREARKRESLGR